MLSRIDAVEERRALRHQRHRAPQRLEGDVRDRLAVDPDASAVELELAQEQRHQGRLARPAVPDQPDLLAALDAEVEVPGEDARVPVGEGERLERDRRAADDERGGARAVGDLVGLQQLLEALAHLAVVADRLGQVLPEEEHPLLEGDHHRDHHDQGADADQPARDEPHADAEHRQDEEGEEHPVRDQQPLRPPPLAQVGEALEADRLPDVLPLEGHLAGELDGVDVGGGVDHLAPQLGRGLGVGEAQLVQPPRPRAR